MTTRSPSTRRPVAGGSQRHDPAERYLSVTEVAERLGTTTRFPRRLIEERRIAFVRFGRHVRIAESVLTAYIESCTVAPVTRRRNGRAA